MAIMPPKPKKFKLDESLGDFHRFMVKALGAMAKNSRKIEATLETKAKTARKKKHRLAYAAALEKVREIRESTTDVMKDVNVKLRRMDLKKGGFGRTFSDGTRAYTYQGPYMVYLAYATLAEGYNDKLQPLLRTHELMVPDYDDFSKDPQKYKMEIIQALRGEQEELVEKLGAAGFNVKLINKIIEESTDKRTLYKRFSDNLDEIFPQHAVASVTAFFGVFNLLYTLPLLLGLVAICFGFTPLAVAASAWLIFGWVVAGNAAWFTGKMVYYVLEP